MSHYTDFRATPRVAGVPIGGGGGGGGGGAAAPIFVHAGSASYAVDPADGYRQAVVLDATAALRTVTLPAVAANAGLEVRVAKSDASANAVRLAAQSGELIESANTYDLTAQHESVIAWSDGERWRLS